MHTSAIKTIADHLVAATVPGYEVQRALMEGERNAAVQAYLDARGKSLDNIHNRKMLEAGFDRGWDAALAAHNRSST